MRDEKEMLQLILGVAAEDERIRAVYLNGSRVNQNVPKDIFQDYDFVYVVVETATFIKEKNWMDVFGERLYLQLPEAMDEMTGKACDLAQCYGYLIQLADGNRIDLHLQTLEYSKKHIMEDKLCIILMDKDNTLPKIPKPSDEDFWVKKPDQVIYSCCCNEFWWGLNNVAKGLWREEIPFVMDMIHLHLRPEMVKMLSWHIGIQTDFSCSIGKKGKYMQRFLTPAIWQQYLSTFSVAQTPAIWTAVFVMCTLFDQIAHMVAQELNFSYNAQEAQNSLFFLKNAHELPKDAMKVL